MKWFDKKGEFKGNPEDKPEESIAEPVVEEVAVPAGIPVSGTPVSLTQEQLLAVIRAMGEEMRKPTPEQQAKLDEDARRRQRENEARISVGKAAAQERERRTHGCNHRMDNGYSEKYAIGQQLCSDGMIHVFCVRCCNEIRTFKPTADQLSVSVA